MTKTSTTQRYKTTPKKRETAQRNRAARSEARKPQAVVVDEALSAAVRGLHRKLSAGELQVRKPVGEVFEAILEGAAGHLVSRRGFATEPSREALRERLEKSRRYKSIRASKN